MNCLEQSMRLNEITASPFPEAVISRVSFNDRFRYSVADRGQIMRQCVKDVRKESIAYGTYEPPQGCS